MLFVSYRRFHRQRIDSVKRYILNIRKKLGLDTSCEHIGISWFGSSRGRVFPTGAYNHEPTHKDNPWTVCTRHLATQSSPIIRNRATPLQSVCRTRNLLGNHVDRMTFPEGGPSGVSYSPRPIFGRPQGLSIETIARPMVSRW